MATKRRSFLKQILIGSAGFAGGVKFVGPQISVRPDSTSQSQVFFRTGTDRRKMILQVLTPLENEVRAAVGRKQIIVKPNFV